jgi:hypothetical protein
MSEKLTEAARIKIVKLRIRNGKVQRRKKVSTVAGFTFRGGKMKRMSPTERRKRRLGAKRAKIKKRSKRVQTLMKRKRSLLKRKRLGF